jgi:hypothetical protein
VFRSARRLTVATLLVVTAAVISACAGGPPGVAGPSAPEPTPIADPSQPYGPYPTLPVTGFEPPVGNTDQQYPELSLSLDGGYLVDLVDPEARAWWIIVAGTGPFAGDRLEIVAEVGDIWPGAVARLYVGGDLVETIDMNGLVGNETAIGGGCHPTLGLCFSSADVQIRPEDGRLTVSLEGSATSRLEIRGATASWDGEPYTLGPWRGTDTVVTG